MNETVQFNWLFRFEECLESENLHIKYQILCVGNKKFPVLKTENDSYCCCSTTSDRKCLLQISTIWGKFIRN